MKARDLNELSDAFLACRSLGHWWEARWTFVENGRRPYYSSRFVCRRELNAGVKDPTEKDVNRYAKGKARGQAVDAPRYSYPDGYQLVRGGGRGGSVRREATVEYLGRIAKEER